MEERKAEIENVKDGLVMKYNKAFYDLDFGSYKSYLESVKDKIEPELYEFVSDSRRHDLEELSLHDSWVEKIDVSEKRKRDKNSNLWNSSVDIHVKLLGPYHDRYFDLFFSSVVSYDLGMRSSAHADLITWEIYVDSDLKEDLLVFNAEFANHPNDDGEPTSFKIWAKNININETML